MPKTYHMTDVVNYLPDGGMRSAIVGLVMFKMPYRVAVFPDSLPWEQATVLLKNKNDDQYVPNGIVLMTTDFDAAMIEKQHSVKRLYTYMTPEEKGRLLGA